jgi:hypothetical protein
LLNIILSLLPYSGDITGMGGTMATGLSNKQLEIRSPREFEKYEDD